ncbi:hypothetical protein [Bacillus sp. ISL-46]|uniref:hypothetical protein n=1 Tax=Bacillus sp. ISL-46 TaxID=2819129 RepID=UPI001BEC1E8F|nr:hypothetical protein [Bacillus sp. ISL-46]MBT2721463.1 hypothetical protein [Bacillus sp. ISL-46]
MEVEYEFNLNDLELALNYMKFYDDELAYLGLTSQSETTLRDRLGYSLFYNFQQSNNFNVIFPREFSDKLDPPVKIRNRKNPQKKTKMDMAVLVSKDFYKDKDLSPNYISIIECKNVYTTGILIPSEWKNWVNNFLSDFEKNDQIIEKRIDKKRITQFEVCFITDFTIDPFYYDRWEDNWFTYDSYIKYLYDMTGGLHDKLKTFEPYRQQGTLLQEIENTFLSSFPSPYYEVRSGKLDRNKKHRLHYFSVDIYYVIIEKKWCSCYEEHLCNLCNQKIIDQLSK